MPSLLKIRVGGASDLPVMDRQSDLTDAYVEIRFADFETQRSSICRKTLNPVWNEDFRFEISSDADLQNEPLEFKVLDYDAITANDAVGSVVIDLNPLLTWDSSGQISGWFPIYDTLRGVRGQLHLQVKLQFFGDVNPFKESSAGVQFFSVPVVPDIVQITSMHGFVDELVNEDDPEYHWSDSFRTPRSSNEARQRLLFRLSGQLRRLLGRKVLELGGNAVLGYRQFFDLESEERSITARAIGTAVKIAPLDTSERNHFPGTPIPSPLSPKTVNTQSQNSFTEKPHPDIFGESINGVPIMEDEYTTTEHRSASGSFDSSGYPSQHGGGGAVSTVAGVQSIHDYMSVEPQVFTLGSVPPGALFNIGGIVTARSVKLIDNDDAELRDAWWAELREEIRSHARALGCPHVIGYAETTSINDELCVLSAVGTAAVVDLTMFASQSSNQNTADSTRAVSTTNVFSGSLSRSWQAITEIPDAGAASGVPAAQMTSSQPLSQNPTPSGHRPSYSSSLKENPALMELLSKRKKTRKKPSRCRACHIPYSRHAAPFPMSFIRCGCCHKKYVPELLLCTIEPPSELQTVGTGAYLEAHVCRSKKRKEGESNATIVSDALPFVEYDIHRQLLYKLRIQGMNAIFGLRLHVTVGDALIVAVASGTALFLSALPAPPPLRISRNLDVIDEEDKKLLEIQRRIMELSEENRREIESFRQQIATESGENRIGEANGGKSSEHESQPKRRLSGAGEIPGDASGDFFSLSGGRASQHRVGISPVDSDSGDSSESESDEEDQESSGTGPGGGVVIQIDDDADEDLMAVLLDPKFGDDFQLCNTEYLPSHKLLSRVPSGGQLAKPINCQLVSVVKQGYISMVSHHPNRQLSSLFRTLFEELRFRLGYFSPCIIAGIQVDVQLPKGYGIQIQLTALALGHSVLDTVGCNEDNVSFRSSAAATDRTGTPENLISHSSSVSSLEKSGIRSSAGGTATSSFIETPRTGRRIYHLSQPVDVVSGAGENMMESPIFPMDEEVSGRVKRKDTSDSIGTDDTPTGQGNHSKTEGKKSDEALTRYPSDGNGVTIRQPDRPIGEKGTRMAHPTVLPISRTATRDLAPPSDHPNTFVEMSPLSFVPGTKTMRHLGTVSLHFVKECHVSRETPTGGLGNFVHEFLAETQAVARAQVVALGGNAIVGLRIDQSLFEENLKSVGYGLVSLSGDVVQVAATEEPRDGSWTWGIGRRR